MKKVYIQPLTEVVKINAEQMICQSQQIGVGENFGGGPGDIQGKNDEDYGYDW